MNVLDIVLISVKIVVFSLTFLSAGGAMFYNLYYDKLDKTEQSIKNALFNTSVFALIVSIIYLFIDVARFAGSFHGIFDYELQKMILQSHLGVAKLTLIFGLVAIIVSFKKETNSRVTLSTIGISLIAFSYTYTGHTAENTYRFIIAPLLMLHLLVVLFWFGSLCPLYYVVKWETNQIAGKIVKDFSVKATYLVPLVFIAGLILSVILMEGIKFLSHNYGLILLFKITIFCILMLIAAVNKWRLGPELELGRKLSARNLQRAIFIEITLILLIISATAILTSYFSPITT